MIERGSQVSPAPDRTLADPHQVVADLRRALAECEAERDAALAREAATAEVLQVINSSPGDLKPVFDAILEKAHSLCGAEYGVLFTYDGELFWTAAIHGAPPSFPERQEGIRPGFGFTGLVRGERFLHLHDMVEVAAQRPDDPVPRRLVERGIRTQLAVPLRKDGRLLGIITANRREVRPFSNKQIALLENFAAQAVIAMENARLLTETREALEQQTATAEVLQVINSSPGDLAPVFDTMLERAIHLCEADFGIMLTVDGAASRVVAERDVPEALSNFLVQQMPDIGPDTFFGRAVLGRSVLHTADMRGEAAYHSGQPLTVNAVDNAGVRALLMAPLLKDDRVLGIFAIFRREVRSFSDKQISLLKNFAAQAVIAIENARLLTETREALEQQTATAEVLQVINSSPGDLAPVFDAILEKAHNLCGADHGSLFLQDGEIFRAIASRGMPEAMTGPLREGVRASDSSLAQPLMAGEPFVHVHDSALDEHPNWIKRALDLVSSHRTLLSIPLRKSGALVGMIVAGRFDVRPFSDKQIALLQNFAAQAVIAMENARLLTETREALEQQTATAEVLQVINSSPGDLAPVFEAILEKAHRLCDIDFGGLQLQEGGKFRSVAMRGLTESLADLLRRPFEPVPESPPSRLLNGERIVHIADMVELAQQGPADLRAQAVAEQGFRTGLFVPLRKDADLLGYIVAFRREVRLYSEKEIALLQNFAVQAVIAMENARLLTETREALQQQTATAEVLQVINSSPGDLAPVFDAMLEKAIHLCEAAFGDLGIFDGEQYRWVAAHGIPDFAEYSFPLRPDGNSPMEQLTRGERLIHLADVRQSDAYRELPAFKSTVDRRAVRSLLVVPLRKDGALLGAIRAYRTEVRPFSDKQIALMQNFAAQAVIAIENARLLTETREALDQQTATAEVLQVINSSPGDLAPVFETILEKAHTLCGATYGGLVIRDRDGFRNVAARGDHPGFIERWRQLRPLHPPQGSPLSRLMAGEKFIHLADAPADDNYRNTTPPEILQLGEFGGLRTLLMVPLRTDDAFLGIITAYRLEVQPFTDKQIALLENFAAQAVIAMENARLLDELHQRTDEVAELNRGLEARVAAQVEELGRVGRLKRFLAPQLAELIVSQGDEKILESHRRDIVVVFCDLRGYTAFTETAEPEEVLDFLREYHGALGPLVSQYEGTLDQFSGDGIMVFFNDPVPCPDPAERAVKMAMAMREAAAKLIAAWRRHGCELGFGAGIAQGYATLGQIGFSERSGYTAIGTVCNLAARLCAEAKDGQILVSSRIAGAVEAVVKLEDLGNLELKGLRRPVAAFNVVQSTSEADARLNLTVVARGPGPRS